MDNPYAAPQSVFTAMPVHYTEAEKIRQAHLSHEASVKYIGTLYYLGAITGLFCLLESMELFAKGVREIPNIALPGRRGLLALSLMVLCWKLAVGLQNLRPWVRIPVIVLSVIGLIGFPLGTLISAYVLYLMLAAKSKMIFSPEYQQIIAATTHLRYRSSFLNTVLFLVLILAVVLSIAVWARLPP